MKICISADHGGFELKKIIIEHIKSMGLNVDDLNDNEYDAEDDYPDTTKLVAESISKNEYDKGIVLCGSGVGASVVANKFKNVRAAICHDTYSASQGVEHDDMNIICLGGRIIGDALAKEIVEEFLKAEFQTEERFERRKDKITEIEDKNFNKNE
ncbi:MAG: ribose-5-phosphate isomerase [Chloroflexi bacterium]|jgi:ribose 5-phosphate isomerase B|nr:MAG: ribose 5-phosphate isomerase B [SAR202 cluster bacterium]MAX12238.1 ribose-5-phosphate isomerase [Chloroflexota bacterium]|tara:strand:+ start:1796 stop:2260 length:465 start_codon:yes stop_codon:yes gene_type:complete